MVLQTIINILVGVNKYGRFRGIKRAVHKAEITNTEDMTLKTKIFYDLNIDSIAIMQIICELEIKYDVTFNEDQLNFEEDI